MNTLNTITLFAIAVLFSTGCSTARFPIDSKPTVKVDQRYIGNWKAKNKDGNTSKEIYSVTKKNDFEYLVAVKLSGNSKTDKFPAYLSQVGNGYFLNIADQEDDSIKGYSFMRLIDINMSGNTITAAFVSDSMLAKLNNSAEVRRRIETNLNNPMFYSDTAILSKIK